MMALESNRSTVVLLSGGLDSAANLALAIDSEVLPNQIMAVTANYGQRAFESEKKSAQSLAEYYGCRWQEIDLQWLGKIGGSSLTDSSMSVPELERGVLDDANTCQKSAKSVWVPNRNGVLINMASALAERIGARVLLVGFNREEAATFPDNSKAYMVAATAALKYSTANQVEVQSFTDALDKTEIVRKLSSLKIPFPFRKVWSCYYSGPQICGKCESCSRFLRAIDQGGVRL